jgi:tRNA (cytidine/uridine-2'-O-)-methyltransferase
MPALIPFNIVLVAPEIPQNTGTIGRLCVCTDSRLHLVKPLGFSLDESRIRRAGLDYWPYLDLEVYEDWDEFMERNQPQRLSLLSTKATTSLYDTEFAPGDWLVFGNESSGFPPDFYRRYQDKLFLIPMPGQHMRSHNLANAVSIALYEAMRQVHWSSPRRLI